MAERPPRAPIFHGWIVVTAAFAVMFVAFGIAYSFAAFFHALRDEFDATRADISLVFAITGFLYFSLGAVSGLLADRIGPRRVILAGVLLIAVGLALASAAQALWQVYVTYSLCVGVGVGLAYVPSVGAVQRWFIKRRGLASGMAVTGIGAGTLVIPLLAAGSIALWDWRVTYLVLAAITLLVGVPGALYVENSPERRGLRPDNEPARPGTNPAPTGLTLREVLRTRPFWLLYSAVLATGIGLFIPFAHLAAYARDEGFSEGFGALLVGMIGVGSTVGRLFLGGWADRVGRRLALAATFVVMASALVGWLGATEQWSLVLFALVFGAAYGGFVALSPALSTDYFGGRNAGVTIGVLYTAGGIGALLGPTIAGAVFEARESYAVPILLGVAMNGVAVACTLALPNPARWRAGAETLEAEAMAVSS